MNKGIASLVMIASIVLASSLLFSRATPADETVIQSPTIALENTDDPRFTQFFCLYKSDAQDVLDVWVERGDAEARSLADALSETKRCAYIVEIHWTRVDEVPCVEQSNGYCIAIQPAFTYLDPHADDLLNISGYLLVQPKMASGNVSRDTDIMGEDRTIISNDNWR